MGTSVFRRNDSHKHLDGYRRGAISMATSSLISEGKEFDEFCRL